MYYTQWGFDKGHADIYQNNDLYVLCSVYVVFLVFISGHVQEKTVLSSVFEGSKNGPKTKKCNNSFINWNFHLTLSDIIFDHICYPYQLKQNQKSVPGNCEVIFKLL